VKIWILGAGGLLGKALIDQCSAQHIPFIASTRAEADITVLEKLRKVAEGAHCTHIINCAAYTNVDQAEKESRIAHQINATGAEQVAMVAKEHGMQLIHVSTDYVFDGEKGTPYTETDAPNPINVYGKSKWEGEQRVVAQFPSACIVRTSWVFGREGTSFISSVIKWLREKDAIQAVEDQVGRATYNKDLVAALLELNCHSGLFHFANGGILSRFQIANDFHKEATLRGLPLRCQEILPVSHTLYPTPSKRPIFSALDTSKVTQALGRPPRHWETVLKEYLDAI